ncbi:MAG: hypothetical protein HW399_787 [Dehalococcoidia bacterium]|nr:hypothetical protein [Dehalococcoidia bacterium]
MTPSIIIITVVSFSFGILSWFLPNLFNKLLKSKNITHLELESSIGKRANKREFKALIWGAGCMGVQVHQQLANCSSHTVDVIGYVDDDPEKKN